MPLHLDYYYGGEAEQYSFYRIPKPLFTEKSYQPMTMEAKVLYGLLLDRMSLSVRNGWLDSAGRVYIFFTLEEAISMLGVGHNKAVRLFQELEEIGLIERRKQGQGRPTVIYVKNFITLSAEPGQFPPPVPDTPPETSQNGKSAHSSGNTKKVETSYLGKSTLPAEGSQDFPKTNANKTERNKTEIILFLRSCGNATLDNNISIEDKTTPLSSGFAVKPDDAVSDSAPAQTDPAEILAELNRQVEESMITMSMNPEPVFKSSSDSGNMLIHNDESNRHAQVVQIIRDSEEDVIYTSAAIPVGKYINSDKLDVALSAGDYPCTAYFHSVNDAGEILGTGAVHIIVHIQK